MIDDYAFDPEKILPFPNRRLDAMAFFHSRHFGNVADTLDIDIGYFFDLHGIPPTGDCSCYSCRSHYVPEAKLVYLRPRVKVCLFSSNENMQVLWKNGKIYETRVMGGQSMTAEEYLIHKGVL